MTIIGVGERRRGEGAVKGLVKGGCEVPTG